MKLQEASGKLRKSHAETENVRKPQEVPESLNKGQEASTLGTLRKLQEGSHRIREQNEISRIVRKLSKAS